MIKEWRRRRAVQRVKPGDGRPLKCFRWWQLPFRALFHLRLTSDGGRHTVYAVDVRHWQNHSSDSLKAHLYREGRLHAMSTLPAAFPVPGGTVEVRMSAFGVKRCHYVTDNGPQYQLVPDPHSAEGRRARLERERPALSRAIGLLSLCVLVAALAVLIPHVAEQLTKSEGIAQRTGTFTSPIDLPRWGDIALGFAAVAASTERALRLRYSWLLDGGAG
ncbi:hypothetical protein IM697_22190 [Streptomyces ferrugineus]|uniref:Uncharacterized protein n=1 Tax=Streptomyces ferrugineus TaxID=1413221 RepID=A0A7M2SWV7_9ACTN|nr:hypothetical protein [Streptomyces ferrugineus]QOV40856.1 hypothetical protein IM697_22190 [Streptomyces ferrugineus]